MVLVLLVDLVSAVIAKLGPWFWYIQIGFYILIALLVILAFSGAPEKFTNIKLRLMPLGTDKKKESYTNISNIR